MGTGSLKAALIGGIAGAVMAVGTAALAGTGVGGIFNLGVDNSVDGQTQLHGSTSNPQLRVNNLQTTDAAVGVLGLHSASGGIGAGVQGESASTAALNASGVLGRMSSTSAGAGSAGVRGVNNGIGTGVYGSSLNGSAGVEGYTRNPSGHGLYGTNASVATGTPGAGVYGRHLLGSGTGAGVFGETNSTSPNATGILAKANGTNAGRDNVALRAINANTNQYGMGVWGSIAGSGWGVLGEAGNNGIGVIGKLAGTGTGVHGQTGAGGVGVKGIGGKTGVYGQATDAGGYAIAANGDASQNRSSGGFIKAMAFIDMTGTNPGQHNPVRCFNSQVAQQADCGITVTRVRPGEWKIDFGFDVSDRFIMLTPVEWVTEGSPPLYENAQVSLCYSDVSAGCDFVSGPNQVGVIINYADNQEPAETPFYIAVF